MANSNTPSPATEEVSGLRWYQGVDRYAWIVLLVCALGWMFDCFDQSLFNLVRAPSVRELLTLEHAVALKNGTMTEANIGTLVKEQSGNLVSIFLIGWAAGGFVFGVLGDKLGRTRTMIITILIYALFTGLNGFAQNMTQYYACRFLVALGVGGEFAAGASLVAEAWPQRSRPMALGLLQALSAVGNITAAFTTLAMQNLSWRYVYFIGALPALLLVFIRKNVHEPEQWHAAKAEAATSGKAMGGILSLFENPILRRNTIVGVLLAGAGVGGLWGVGFFSADFVGTLLKQAGASPGDTQKWKSIMFIVQNIGGGLGMFTFAVVAERLGRRRSLFIFFTLAFISLQVFFRFVHDVPSAVMLAFPLGFCTLGPFAAFAIYFPELYPTRLRSTGIGFCYNSARILAAIAPYYLGQLGKRFAVVGDDTAGYRTAASIVAFIYILGFIGLIFAPETKGKPLPE